MTRNATHLFIVLLTLLGLGGCATGLDKKATAVDWSKGSIVVMSVELTNAYKPSYPPTNLGVFFKRMSGTDNRAFVLASSDVPSGKNTVVVSQQIQPGSYTVSKLWGMHRSFPIAGGIDFSVDAPFKLAAKSVVYLGRVTAINKERVNKDDQGTGGILPLIDQAVTGFGNGTLAVTLSDNYAEDVSVVKNEFPFLQPLEVLRMPLQKMTLERTTASSAPLVEVRAAAPISATESATSAAQPAPSIGMK